MDKDEIEITLRQATDADLPFLKKVAAAQGDAHEDGYFDRCLAEQTAGNRVIVVATMSRANRMEASGDGIAGYVQLIWQPIYTPFKLFNIPEIQDLAVSPDFRHRGIGERMVRYCERIAQINGRVEIGIGVGLHGRFGAAQRLYARLGYIPDGNGVIYDEDTPVNRGDLRVVDDLLTLKFSKKL